MKAVIADNITKKYKDKTAVNGVSFAVEEGEIFGLIGPDGAGKTSIFRILTTLLLPDGGKATVQGWDVVTQYASIRNAVGYMPGRFSLYQDLTVEENLQFFATVFKTTLKENYALIRDIYVQLEPFKNRRAGKLSGGMKQKLALCCALIHKPSVLFLDEPTTGVDPVSRREFWDMLKNLKQQGITILVSTPYMDEAARCDHMALIHEGDILTIDTPQHLVSTFGEALYRAKTSDMYGLLKSLKGMEDIRSYAFGEYAHIAAPGQGKKGLERIARYLQGQDLKEVVLEPAAVTIEDCFIKMLGT